MRISQLHIQNFKKFTSQDFDLHPQFTLLVGENGAGKTSMLDALAVAMGVWLADVPDSMLSSSKRNISQAEIRLEPSQEGDRIQFRECPPVVIRATGQIGDNPNVTWVRQIRSTGKRTSNADAKEALSIISDIYRRDKAGEKIICPVLAYYGAGRTWLPSTERTTRESKSIGAARRWAAFYDCFSERIRFPVLRKWFHRETTAAGNRAGKMRPGFEVVRRAILGCVPGADGVWYDPDLEQIVLSINGYAQPLDNLSAGQRMMLALVADIAIKAVTQNAHLIPADKLEAVGNDLPRVLAETPGVVLIDELDVHLHPRWQRRVATDLKRTFPQIQFICTSHSPQVIGELSHEEIRHLEDSRATTPERSYGIDSSRILEEMLDTKARTESMDRLLKELFEFIDEEKFDEARDRLKKAEEQLGSTDPEITRARTLMTFLEEAK